MVPGRTRPRSERVVGRAQLRPSPLETSLPATVSRSLICSLSTFVPCLPSSQRPGTQGLMRIARPSSLAVAPAAKEVVLGDRARLRPARLGLLAAGLAIVDGDALALPLRVVAVASGEDLLLGLGRKPAKDEQQQSSVSELRQRDMQATPCDRRTHSPAAIMVRTFSTSSLRFRSLLPAPSFGTFSSGADFLPAPASSSSSDSTSSTSDPPAPPAFGGKSEMYLSELG
jgi:hypothetical protein